MARSWLRATGAQWSASLGGGGGGSGYAAVSAAERAAAGSGEESEATAEGLRAWYAVARERLPPALSPAVRLLHADGETQAWLRSCGGGPGAGRPQACTRALAAAAAAAALVLRLCLSVTDANALLRRGDMFVLSDAQLRGLLAPEAEEEEEEEEEAAGEAAAARGAGVASAAAGGSGSAARALPPPLRLGRLLDVGAGDGGVTAVLARHFREVHATEVSARMAARLRERGFARVVQSAFLGRDVFPEDGVYDVISLLNVLDRTDQPAALLADARRLLAPGGRLLLAVVLPFSEFVEEGTVRRHVRGPLPMAGARCGDGADFESSLSALLTRAVIPAGFDIVSISRVPYLCRGDMHRPYYVLSDAIIVARPAAAAAAGLAPAAALSQARNDVEYAALLPAPAAARRRD